MTERNKLTDLQERWLTALESGEYKQTRGDLCKHGGYCCLGVATDVFDPEHAALEGNGWSWRRDYDIEYDIGADEYGEDGATAPPEVVKALDLTSTLGVLRLEQKRHDQRSLASLNDEAELTFTEIAAMIRAEPWLVFTNFDVPEDAQ